MIHLFLALNTPHDVVWMKMGSPEDFNEYGSLLVIVDINFEIP